MARVETACVPQILFDFFDLDPDYAGVGNIDERVFRRDLGALVWAFAECDCAIEGPTGTKPKLKIQRLASFTGSDLDG